MSEQKPVACRQGIQVGFKTTYTYYDAELCELAPQQYEALFTADQLKAEREKAIKMCADICVENSKEFNDPFQGVRDSHRILALLPTDESKEVK
jgi:hypothetical protein